MDTAPVYLNGEFEVTEDSFDVINPGSGETIGRMSSVGRARVREAIADAGAAWPAWRERTALERGNILNLVAEKISERGEEIAEIITRENGKPFAQSKGEVAMTIDHFRWFAEEARRAYGRIIPHQAEGKRHLAIRSPIGVVGAIVPWNFPLVLTARKAAPALAAGCPVILKAAAKTPLCTAVLAECMDEAGIPAGVFQLVAGPAREIAAEFFSNPACRKVSFTGSTEVGKELIRQSAQTVTRLSLELGGHAPVLVFADADLDLAVEGAITTKFRNTGQSCIAANRIIVQDEIYAEFTAMFCDRVDKLVVGDGMEPGVDIGPLIDQSALDTAVRHVEEAVRSGAELLRGGRPAARSRGFFLEPTVLGKVPPSAVCMREESFAPIAPVSSFAAEEEAIGMANDTEYGLAAYAYTSDLTRAFRLMERLEAGTIGINDAVPSTSQCPFGGVKQSGLGRELGIEGMDAYLETKHVSLGGIR